MNSIVVHFIPGAIISLPASIWLYVSASGIVALILLLVFLLKRTKKRKTSPTHKKTPQSGNSETQGLLKTIQKISDRNQPVLLAATRVPDLPVTIPINLAVSLAETGSCLLIDLDSKRDALAKVFDIDSSRIDRHLRIEPILTEFNNLSIWPARYFDLLKQMNLRSLLQAASEKYDHILIYAPYLPVLPDRKQIAFCSKQVIVFCKAPENANNLHSLLKTADCKIILEA